MGVHNLQHWLKLTLVFKWLPFIDFYTKGSLGVKFNKDVIFFLFSFKKLPSDENSLYKKTIFHSCSPILSLCGYQNTWLTSCEIYSFDHLFQVCKLFIFFLLKEWIKTSYMICLYHWKFEPSYLNNGKCWKYG